MTKFDVFDAQTLTDETIVDQTRSISSTICSKSFNQGGRIDKKRDREIRSIEST